jgi:uncharacterized RDD family membrane protein YckC
LASDGNWYPPESHPEVLDQTRDAVSGPGRYAGFWLRVAAMLLDLFIVWIGASVAVIVLGILTGPFSVLVLAVPWLYFATQESSDKQATIGKKAVGIKVTDLAGDQITFGRATGRFFGKFLSALIVYIGFMMAGWTEKKQTLHDMLADTLVVRG